MDISKEKICELVDKSIQDKQYNNSLIFPIPRKTIIRIKSLIGLNMQDYQCRISSSGIRHIHYRHPDDIVSLEFYKKYDNNIVKLVKLRIYKHKFLELKTLFVQ